VRPRRPCHPPKNIRGSLYEVGKRRDHSDWNRPTGPSGAAATGICTNGLVFSKSIRAPGDGTAIFTGSPGRHSRSSPRPQVGASVDT